MAYKPDADKVAESNNKLEACRCHHNIEVSPTPSQKTQFTEPQKPETSGPSTSQPKPPESPEPQNAQELTYSQKLDMTYSQKTRSKNADEGEWTRLGPMGPLVQPQLIGAKTSAVPETPLSQYNQPNVFMKKLEQKYPFIYECLKTGAPDDLISRVNKDRLATTYQVDYCKKVELPSAPYDKLLDAAGVEGMPPCPEPVKIPVGVCRPRGSINAKKNSSFSKNASFEKTKSSEPKLGSCRGGAFTVTMNSTEYMDTHSRLGNLIIRDGIHDPDRRKVMALLK